jgi:hypothetical protein
LKEDPPTKSRILLPIGCYKGLLPLRRVTSLFKYGVVMDTRRSAAVVAVQLGLNAGEESYLLSNHARRGSFARHNLTNDAISAGLLRGSLSADLHDPRVALLDGDFPPSE